ncbi:MAG: S46 family peptidase [Myxococcota bacterium]
MGLLLLVLLGWGWETLPHDGFHHPNTFPEKPVQMACEAVVSFDGRGTGFLISASGDILTNHHIAQAFGSYGIVERHADRSSPSTGHGFRTPTGQGSSGSPSPHSTGPNGSHVTEPSTTELR